MKEAEAGEGTRLMAEAASRRRKSHGSEDAVEELCKVEIHEGARRRGSSALLEEGGNLVTLLELVVMNSFVGAYGLIQVSMFMLVLPKQCAALFPGHQAVGLATMLGLAGATQLVCPVAGMFSDRMTSPFGKRRPFILVATIVAVLSLGVLWYLARDSLHIDLSLHSTSSASSAVTKTKDAGLDADIRNVYIVAFVVLNLSLNVCFAAYAGLIPDFVGDGQLGQASGIMAVMNALGALLGVWLIGFLLVEPFSLYAGWLVLCCVVTLVVVKETPSTKDTTSQEGPEKIACSDIFNVYFESLEKDADFFWVWISRLLYYMGISVQVFMQFFIRDVIGVSPDDAKTQTAMVSVMTLFCSSLVAVPCGMLSDKVGRKPLVYLSCFLMALTYVGWSFASELWEILAWSSIFGFANGTYLAVDYALGCDKIPDKAEGAAQALGVWGVAAFLGSTLGPVISGPVLYIVGKSPEPDVYLHRGYVSLLAMGAVLVFSSSLALRKVT